MARHVGHSAQRPRSGERAYGLTGVATCALFVSVIVSGCGSSGGGGNPDAASANTGGSANGGSSGNSGAPSGGAVSTGGSANSGSSGNSGAPSGGAVSTGGSANGGSSGNGGAPSGGAVSTGGSANGGSSGNSGAPDGGDAGPNPCRGVRPGATNTGVPAGVTLTVVNDDVTVTDDGTTIDAEDIHGFLIVKASNVKVTRSIVRGGVATHNGDGIAVQSGSNVLIEDTEVAIANPSAYLDGVSGQNFTVRRANIHGGVDGMKVGSNSVVECSYIHDMMSFAMDPNQGGGPTHNDAIQILSGTNIRIFGNSLIAAMDQNSAIQVTQDFGTVTDLVVDSNYADGGGCTFNFSHKGGTSLTGVTVTNNRFGRNSYYNCPILKSTQTTLMMSGNVWDDDGTPVPVQTHD